MFGEDINSQKFVKIIKKNPDPCKKVMFSNPSLLKGGIEVEGSFPKIFC